MISLEKTPQQEKKGIKELGPDRPRFTDSAASDGERAYTRGFTRSCYGKQSWLTECGGSNAFNCFDYLLFQSVGTGVQWKQL